MLRICPKLVALAKSLSLAHSDPATGRIYLAGDGAKFIAAHGTAKPDDFDVALVANDRDTFDTVVELLAGANPKAKFERADSITVRIGDFLLTHYFDLPEALRANDFLLDVAGGDVFKRDYCDEIDCKLAVTYADGRTETDGAVLHPVDDNADTIEEYLKDNFDNAAKIVATDEADRTVFVWEAPKKEEPKQKTFTAQAYGFPDTKVTVNAVDKYEAMEKARELIPGNKHTVIHVRDIATNESYTGYTGSAAKALTGDVKYTITYQSTYHSTYVKTVEPTHGYALRPATDSYDAVLKYVKDFWLGPSYTLLTIKADKPNAANIPGTPITV